MTDEGMQSLGNRDLSSITRNAVALVRMAPSIADRLIVYRTSFEWDIDELALEMLSFWAGQQTCDTNVAMIKQRLILVA